VTTYPHVRDWKLTTGHLVLMKIGWGVVVLAVYLAAAATIFDSAVAWWIVAGLAIIALATALSLPGPVPKELLTGSRTYLKGRGN
jgi:predicted cobalt transporter CbtA